MHMRGISGRKRVSDPFDRADWLSIAQGSDDRVEVREVVNLDVQMEGLEAAVAMDELKVDDVGMLLAKDARHGAERAWNVAQDHRETGCAAIRALTPRKVEPIGIDPARQR